MKGSLIVIEGIDGAGGETQTRLLKDYLNSRGKNVLPLSYPEYSGGIGSLINDFLHKKYDFDADVQFALYAADMVKDRKKISDFISDGGVIVANRYLTSTLTYQTIKGFELEKGLKFAELFGLPVPNLVIFVDIDAETSMRRKMGEKNSLDRHEADKQLLENVRGRYLELASKNVFAKEWKVIDGTKPIDEVAKEIQQIVLKLL